MKRKRDCRPLILLYTAIIVGFKETKSVTFIDRYLFYINPWRVYVRDNYPYAFPFNAVFANFKKYYPFITIDKIPLVATF